MLAGIGIGMLLAPDKGSATRKKLTGKFSDLKDQAKDGIDDLADNAKHAINSARQKVKSALN